MNGLRLPVGTGRSAMAAAGLAWLGTLAGWSLGLPAMLIGSIVGAAAAATRRPVAGALLVAAIASGWAAAARVDATFDAPVAEGPAVLSGRVADEPARFEGRVRFVLLPEFELSAGRWQPAAHPPLAVTSKHGQYEPTAGDAVVVRGVVRSYPGRVRGDPVAGRVAGASVEFVAESRNPLFTAGNMLRRRVKSRLSNPVDPQAAALVRGFLIGDTNDLSTADTEALRRSGLSHFVAVSGSNVALFLAGWWLVTAPIAGRPRMRAASGLLGLGIFVIVTRWEASVVRAAVMAAIVLGARLLGMPIDAWTALGTATAGLLLVSGDLATSVGFQLSVFATAGVLAGARAFSGRRPRWLWSALGATTSAQAAVMPLLLFHFGTVPLLSPVANMAAMPLVTLSTVLAGIGVTIGSDVVMRPALWAAGGVLAIAREASTWPQLGPVAAGGLGALVSLVRRRRSRAVVALSAFVALVVVVSPASTPVVPTMTALDVGQGDAILLQDGEGATVLIDGGREPAVLEAALRRHGVDDVDLLVVTHGDVDHSGGLAGLLERRAVGRVWVPDQPGHGPVLEALLADAAARRVPVDRLRAPATARVGRFSLTVLGPVRRYASINDGSIVLWAKAGGHTILLAGDIEKVAQAELPAVRPDILLVPHHGSATTDIDWLQATVGGDAVVSVGRNSYGHPSAAVMEALADSGARIWVTAEFGDITVPLGH